MKEEQRPTFKDVPLRRSLFALTPAERKRYFWCLKAIGFLPAHSTTREYFYRGAKKDATYQEKVVKPQTIQDELVGSHATVCEHQTIYFAHYHRHLTAVFEMELSYAEEFLLGQHKDSDFYIAHKEKFDVVIKQFTQLYENNPEVKKTKTMAHYWNPTHYLNDADIIPPVELLDPVFARAYLPKQYQTYQIQSIDLLYHEANNAYPWEFNFQEKWFKGRDFEALRPEFKQKLTEIKPDDEVNTYFSSKTDYFIDPKTLRIIQGTLNPRGNNSVQLADFFEGFLGKDSTSAKIEDFALFYEVSTMSKVRSTFYFDHGYAKGETQNQGILAINKMRTWNCHHLETLSQFGALSKNLQWISQIERKYYRYSDLFSIKAQIYNNNLPHYQIAYAYFSKEVNKGFLTFLADDANDQTKVFFESSHDCIHDFNQYFMRDGSFSLCNLLFFPYHSYIDLALELKIREVATSEYEKTKYLLEQYHNKLQVFEYLFYPKNKQVTKGEYKVMEWANPSLGMLRHNTYEKDPQLNFTLKDVQYFVDFQTYCLSEQTKSIRRSYQFKDLYNKQFKSNQKNSEKYKTFKGFRDYDFNYNYEMFEYDVIQNSISGAVSIVYSDKLKKEPKVIKTILTDQQYYPKHLQIIRADIQFRERIIVQAITEARVRTRSNRNLMNIDFRQITKYYEMKGIDEDLYSSLLNQPFLVVGNYHSSLSSGLYKLSIVANNSFRPYILGKLNDRAIGQKLIDGLDVTSLNILSRDGTSSNCSRCKEFKYFSIDLNSKIQSYCTELWKFFTDYQNSDTSLRYSDNNQHLVANNSLKDCFQVLMAPAFSGLQIAQGAEQIQIFTKYKGPSNITGTIKVDAVIFSVFSGDMKSLISHSDDTFDTKFNFDKAVLFAGSTNIPGDRAIYKELRIRIVLNKKNPKRSITTSKIINFKIKSYLKVVRYDIRITANQNNAELKVAVEIKDKDHLLKKEYIDAYVRKAMASRQ